MKVFQVAPSKFIANLPNGAQVVIHATGPLWRVRKLNAPQYTAEQLKGKPLVDAPDQYIGRKLDTMAGA